MTDLIVDVKPRGTTSAYAVAPFDIGKEALEGAGYNIISLQENARLRMQEGKDADISRNGNWTREGVLYIPDKGAFLTRNSPIMANAKEATDCHRNGKEFYLTPEQVEQSLQGSVKLTSDSIPTERFKDNEVTVYAFGNDAEKYGSFLKEAGIDKMPVWLASLGDKAFARQMWLLGLSDDSWSGLVGGGILSGCGGVRGVFDSAEGTARKNSSVEAYTIQDIQRVLKAKGLTGIEGILIDGLKEA